MCDCYYHKCEFCNKEIYMHIVDYSTSRDNVSVVCPWCIRKSRNRAAIEELRTCANQVSEEIVHDPETVREYDEPIGRNHWYDDRVLIVCRDPRAGYVSLNQ